MTLTSRNIIPASDEVFPPRRRILLVEDHVDTANLLKRLLERNACDVTTANSFRDAVAAAESAQFDIILSDVNLPDGNGCNLLPRLRESQGDIPALALTGAASAYDLAHQRQAGFTATLAKPCSLTEIMSHVEACVSKPL